MSSSGRQKPRRVSIGSESLESRRLLNAHVPHHAAAHVATILQAEASVGTKVKVPHSISGTVNGIVITTLNQNNSNQGYETYAANGSARQGEVTYFGTDGFTSTAD